MRVEGKPAIGRSCRGHLVGEAGPRRPAKGEPLCPHLRRSFALPGPDRRATLHPRDSTPFPRTGTQVVIRKRSGRYRCCPRRGGWLFFRRSHERPGVGTALEPVARQGEAVDALELRGGCGMGVTLLCELTRKSS
jgi:hypothetical protein